MISDLPWPTRISSGYDIYQVCGRKYPHPLSWKYICRKNIWEKPPTQPQKCFPKINTIQRIKTENKLAYQKRGKNSSSDTFMLSMMKYKLPNYEILSGYKSWHIFNFAHMKESFLSILVFAHQGQVSFFLRIYIWKGLSLF